MIVGTNKQLEAHLRAQHHAPSPRQATVVRAVPARLQVPRAPVTALTCDNCDLVFTSKEMHARHKCKGAMRAGEATGASATVDMVHDDFDDDEPLPAPPAATTVATVVQAVAPKGGRLNAIASALAATAAAAPGIPTSAPPQLTSIPLSTSPPPPKLTVLPPPRRVTAVKRVMTRPAVRKTIRVDP